MSKYLLYKIKNIQPVKVPATLNQDDNEFTRCYLSGSSIRGAYISEYIRRYKIDNLNKGEHREKLLKGRIKFYNAYPSFNQVRSYPIPKCLYMEKDVKLDEKMISIKLESKEGYKRVSISEFISIYGNKLIPVKVKKNNNIHIKKGTSNSSNNIYRYEAISEGNEFEGIIEFTGENAINDREECIKILKNHDEVYIGGSKSSGYGLCKIYDIMEVDKNPEIDELFKKIGDCKDRSDNQKTFYIYALSDIIYRLPNGLYSGYIDEKSLEDKLGVTNVELVDSFNDIEVFTGFNYKWGYRLPLISGIKAGSIFQYRYDGEIDKDKSYCFMCEGIGERQSEGFGRFAILDSIPFDTIDNENKKSNRKEKELELDENQREQMQLILNRMYKNKIEEEIRKVVLSLSEKSNLEILNDNQCGKLLRLCEIIEPLNIDEAERMVDEYFLHIDSKKTNRSLSNILKSVKIDRKNVDKYIKYAIKDLNKRKFIKYTPLKSGDITASLTKEEVYRYRLIILKELFRMRLKDCKKAGDNNGN